MSAAHSMRRMRDRYTPFLSKYGALKIVNPIRRSVHSGSSVADRLDRAMKSLEIRHLDLGGMNPVEGYLTIHLSPVELYGKVLLPRTTMESRFDGERVHVSERELTAPAVVINYDVTGGLPLSDGSLLGLNMSHFLEHFPLETGLRLLAECRRVLSPGGVLRVSCPDLRRYAVAYVNQDSEFFRSVGTSTYCNYDSLRTFGERFISKAYDNRNGHLWFYDAETIIHRLKAAGFREAADKRAHESALPEIAHIEPSYREIESFYVEAVL